MKRGQKVEVVKVGDASSDTEFPKFPSRTPYGKLIGKRGVIRCENAGHIGSWVVRFEDFSEHALPEEYLVAIEEPSNARGPYDVDYPLPDPGDPPSDQKEMVRQIMEEGLFQPGDFTSWIWERTLLTGDPRWFLETSPLPDLPYSAILLVTESVVNAETDPEKALVLLWRYRGRKKETMRSFEAYVLEGPLGKSKPSSVPSGRSLLYRERDELRHRLTAALEVLDAIYRAHTPGKGCAPGCACTLEEDEDCDCGYQEAADDVAAYAHEVHEALSYEAPQEPPALGWTWTDTPLVSVADNGVCVVQEESGMWAIEYRCLLLVACLPTRTAGRRCAEKMGMEAIQKQCEESLRTLMGNDGSNSSSTGEA